jgi:hypothetical protein
MKNLMTGGDSLALVKFKMYTPGMVPIPDNVSRYRSNLGMCLAKFSVNSLGGFFQLQS